MKILIVVLAISVWTLPVAAQDTVPQDLPLVREGLTPALPDTVRADAIQETNGFAVLRETEEPFTGTIIDVYPSGAKRMQRSVVEGRAEGLWIEWYESGIPRYMATWRDGKGEGVWTYYHENGMVRERATVVGDAYTGPVEGWHATGAKAMEGYYQDWQRKGTWRFWSEDGTLLRTEWHGNIP